MRQTWEACEGTRTGLQVSSPCKASYASQHLAALLLKAHLFLYLVTKIILSGAHEQVWGVVLSLQ